jgi:proteasome lid subunit RPN8/RPN11
LNLVLSPGLLDEIIQHSKSAYPREGCGLIAGIKPSFVGGRFPSASEFEMDPAELIKALREMRNAGEELVAIYHSHPHGPARPSKTDVQRAFYPDAAHLIVSLAEPERPQVRAFRILNAEILDIEVHAIV